MEGPQLGDAFGVALLDELDGARSTIVIERDDGFLDVDGSDYFTEVADDALWLWMRSRVGPRVLDVGAGAGRAALRLQRDGVDVVALDVSPGCVEICKRRGVAKTFLGTIDQLAATSPDAFDSLLCLGNNLGLIASPEAAGRFFTAARALGGPDMRIVGTMLDPYDTENPIHLASHERNRAAGRLAGAVRIRVRYQNLATDWFELLWVSPDELGQIAQQSGWELTAVQPAGIFYAAELRPH